MNIFREADDILAKRRKDRSDLIDARNERIMKNERFAETEKAIRTLIPALAKATVLKDEKSIKTLQKKCDALNRVKDDILAQLNLPRDFFSPAPFCAKCNDTGFKDGKACSCYNALVLDLIEQESGLSKRQKRSFSDCDFSVFADKDRQRAETLYAKMREYTNKFPNVKKNNLLFTGQSGTGKTFLIDIVYGELINKGVIALYTTAFTLNNIFLKYHTTFDESKYTYLDNLINCELLIIDDLGTEPILKNVTVEYLFSLINERKILKKATIVSTNLQPDKIAERYGERTASRIYDKNDTTFINMNFDNLRNKKK